jgi:AraC-like DNA-binding protein
LRGVGKRGAANIAAPSIEFVKTEGPLMPFVESYFLYRNDAIDINGIDRVDMGQILFMLKGSGHRIFPDGHVEPSQEVMINGPGTAASTHHIDGPFHCFGLSLRATGWKALVGLPAHKVGNRVLGGVELFGPEALALLVRLRRLDRVEDMVRAVEPFLVARRKPVPRTHLALNVAVREWVASGEPGVDGLFARAGMSRRQVTRLCNEYFGGPPKLLERKFRAIRAAMRIYHGEDPKDAAAPFADQPHMIKELKRFTGHTPTTLRDGIDPVLAFTLDNESFHFLPDVIPEAVDVGDP